MFGANGRHRKRATIGLAALLGAAGIAGAVFAFSGGSSEAAESCQGLDTALQNNLNFIAGQQANPDAQSEARIANRQAVVDLIQQRRQAAGCTGNVAAQPVNTGGSGESCEGLDKALQNNLNFIAGQKANPDAQSEARIANRQAVVDLIQQRRKAANCTEDVQAGGNAGGGAAEEEPAGNGNAGNGNAGNGNGNAGNGNAGNNNGGGAGEVVCQGSTVTLSGEAGAPAASSNEFPIGTQLKVTNLDNNKSTTVEVTGPSGSCALLNNAAFEQVREPGKFLIRRARIERVG
ncbi:septal ring lytic transglycosylase RlpA family protein [Kibdelosporangium philippinense]|uniref:Septal ring lytic transglycosylase RlpA family protein n=1 Tax=Kibdelosporangium philippinense TaxID=211113 RepID=A0ABS8ZLC9_9PSEU|nr:septal ring lytic transglycosylase RlpA family protein [Kibdelosporangium philippinense]MCE7008584.1 septal ring lytic transglycosylase RlpA family protein [Kibdelosporangium philippinense]